MASVAETRAEIDNAIGKLQEAHAALGPVAERLGEASAHINWIRQTSVDPMGGPQVQSALDHADEIGPLIVSAIEALQTYGATL